MKRRSLLFVLVLLAIPAGDRAVGFSPRGPSNTELSRAGAEGSTVGTQPDDVLKLAPADAFLIAYTADVDGVALHPLFSYLADPDSRLPALAEAFAAAIDGPAMLSAGGVVANPFSWRIVLAARTPLDQSELFDHLSNELVPAWNGSPPARRLGEMQFFQVGTVGRLMVIGPVSFFMTVATRDGLLFGSTRPGEAEDWLDGVDPGEPFVEGEEFDRLSDGRSAPVGALIYLDVRSLVPLAEMQLDRVLPNLSRALQLEKVESLALISDCPVDADKPSDAGERAGKTELGSQLKRYSPVWHRLPAGGNAGVKPVPHHLQRGIRLAIGVTGIERGLSHLLASTPMPATLARVYPADTTFLLHGSMERASSIVDDIGAIAALIGMEIVEEYEQERADFKEDVGFDPHDEFLANFVKEWAFGASISPGTDDLPHLEHPLFAARLENPTTFKKHMHALRAAYQLEISRTAHREVTIDHAVRSTGPFSYAVVDDVLMVSPDAGAIKRAIDASLDDTGLARTAAFETVSRRLGPRTSKLVFLDVAKVFAGAVESAKGAQYPQIVKLVESRSSVGLAVIPHERMIALELASTTGDSTKLIDVIASAIVQSVRRTRHLSQRKVSMANIKAILTGCLNYADAHKNRWPGSLDKLVASGVLGAEAEAAHLLTGPYDATLDHGEPFYLYRHIANPSDVRQPFKEVVLSEPRIQQGGAAFGFIDGHVEWIPSPRADELLAIMQGGQ